MIKHLDPTVVRKIWGGQNLEKLKVLPTDNTSHLEPIGETWEIYLDHLPYLAKFIDTSEELSIQVHPGDEYARLHEHSLGKTECWIILEAHSGDGIYLGLKDGVTKEKLEEALEKKSAIQDLLNFYPVKRGDFFFVPSGSIHAIGKNITLAEVQQNSGITYRVWDWNRVDEKGLGRELHVKKSLDVINFDPSKNKQEYFQFKTNLFDLKGLNQLCAHSHFELSLLNMKVNDVYHCDLNLKRPCGILNLNGKKKINSQELEMYSALIIEDETQLNVESMEEGSLLLIF